MLLQNRQIIVIEYLYLWIIFTDAATLPHLYFFFYLYLPNIKQENIVEFHK